jgi:hypothetical protein
VRDAAVHPKEINLEYFEEVFTSSRWIVRIYKLKDAPNRGKKTKNVYPLLKAE